MGWLIDTPSIPFTSFHTPKRGPGIDGLMAAIGSSRPENLPDVKQLDADRM